MAPVVGFAPTDILVKQTSGLLFSHTGMKSQDSSLTWHGFLYSENTMTIDLQNF